MDDGGLQSPAGRSRRVWGRRHGRQYRVERALSASALLPTAAFTALSVMTVLVVTQIGMSPLGTLGDPTAPSARDGGRAVTPPRVSISIARPLVSVHPPADTVRPEANPAVTIVVAVLTLSTKEPGARQVPQSPHGQFAPAATFAATTTVARSAVNVTADEPPKPSKADKPSKAEDGKPSKAEDAEDAEDGKDAKTDEVSHRVERCRDV